MQTKTQGMKQMGSVLDLFADLTEPAIGNEGKGKGEGPKPLLIAVTDIQPDPNQPRKEFDPEQIDNLAESIRRVGVLQPLLLAETSATHSYQIIEGERRWLAAQRAGLLEVPAYVRQDLSSDDIALAQIIANANRTDLTDYELARAIQALLATQRIKKKEVAVLINKSLSAVSRLIGMLNPDVRPYVEEGLIRHAETSALFRSLSKNQRSALLEQVRADRCEITTTMIRELQLHPQDHGEHRDQETILVTAKAINQDKTKSDERGLGLAAESEAASDHLQNSLPDNTSTSERSTDEAAMAGERTAAGAKSSRSKETIDFKLTVHELASLVSLLTKASDADAPVWQQAIAIRIPCHCALALMEAMGALAPANPSDYAGTILKLLKERNT